MNGRRISLHVKTSKGTVGNEWWFEAKRVIDIVKCASQPICRGTSDRGSCLLMPPIPLSSLVEGREGEVVHDRDDDEFHKDRGKMIFLHKNGYCMKFFES